MTKLYPDISHHKTITDWDKLMQDVVFIISKGTEGKTFVDDLAETFIEKCEKYKKPYFLYSFVRKGTELDGAKFLVKKFKDKVGSHFVGWALDVETASDGTLPTVDGVQKAVDYLDSLGGKFLLYTMHAQYEKYKDVIKNRPKNCAWWEARYGANNGKDTSAKYPCHNGVDLHQYTSKARINGVKELVDLNKLTGKKHESWFTTPSSKTITTNISASKDNKNDKISLTVDGKWGTNTTKRAQQYFGTTVDGKISNQLNCYKSICKGILSAEWSDKKNGGSVLVKAMQKWLGITQDGYIGPKFIKALQKKMGTTVDGKLDNPSTCIKAFQTWLNKQK